MTGDSTENVDDIWDEFETWLDRNHPLQLASLNPPATESQLQRLEAELAAPLAPDFRQSLLRHNGATGTALRWFPHGHALMTADAILATVQMLNEIAADNDFEDWWSASYVPIAAAGNGDHHCIDLSPLSSDHRVFEWYHDDNDEPTLASSYTAWLRRSVDAYLAAWDLAALGPFAGHAHVVEDLDWSRDNQWVLSIGDYCTARLWDAESGEAVADLDDVPSRSFMARFSPAGERLAIAGSYLRVFESAAPGFSSTTFPTSPRWYSSSIGWLPDGERVVALRSESLEVWDATTAKLLAELPMTGEVLSGSSTLALARSEARAAILSSAGLVVIGFDQRTPRIEQFEHLGPHYRYGAALDWAPDSEQLAASNNQTLQIFDSRTLRPITNLALPDSANNRLVAWAPDGRHLATGGDRCRIWSAANREQIAEQPASGLVSALAWAPDSERLAVGDNSGSLRLWTPLDTN